MILLVRQFCFEINSKGREPFFQRYVIYSYESIYIINIMVLNRVSVEINLIPTFNAFFFVGVRTHLIDKQSLMVVHYHR